MGPVRYREVRSIPLKYARNFIFDPFLRFFPLDFLRCVPEDTCPAICGVRLAERPTSRGTTVFASEAGRNGRNKLIRNIALVAAF